MNRILFVDDEQRVLDGLANALRKYRKKWEMVFVCGAEAALEALSRAPFDVIVTDARMPVMDGEVLLRQVQERFPAMGRIVLSGQADERIAHRLVNVAHQFLSKPCDPAMVCGAVERALFLSGSVIDGTVRELIGGVGQLPVYPRVYQQLTELVQRTDSTVEQLADIVEGDTGLAAKVLQVSNSAFFALPRLVTSVRDAVCYLGTEPLRNLVLYVEVFASTQATLEGDPVARWLRSHALLKAQLARRIMGGGPPAETAFTAGILADVGLLVLAVRRPEEFARFFARYQSTGEPTHVLELEYFETTHAVVGAALLNLWGLPAVIVDAVSHHHHLPDSLLPLTPKTAVYLAARIGDHAEHPDVEASVEPSIEVLAEQARIGHLLPALWALAGAPERKGR